MKLLPRHFPEYLIPPEISEEERANVLNIHEAENAPKLKRQQHPPKPSTIQKPSTLFHLNPFTTNQPITCSPPQGNSSMSTWLPLSKFLPVASNNTGSLLLIALIRSHTGIEYKIN